MIVTNQKIKLPVLTENQVEVYLKREDTIHPHISGNKFRKLKYNLIEARKRGFKKLLTFGGAFSNHIAAVSFAGKQNSFETIGVIRGEELEKSTELNPTLKFAIENEMQLHYVSRKVYGNKNTPAFLGSLQQKFGDFYLLPEGGTNVLAIQGCEEILTEADQQFDYICCAVGTGGTIAGIINSSNPYQKVIGFPALKGDLLIDDIRNFTIKENWELYNDYHFGGYAKIDAKLVEFINNFKEQTSILLDPIYTGKMVYGVLDLVRKNKIKRHSKVLAIHTGGLQGIRGMNIVLKKKNLPEIHY